MEIYIIRPIKKVFMKLKISLFFFTVFLLAMGINSPAAAAESINAFVSIPPQQFFVTAIGKDRVKTTAIVSPAHSPADYEPSPSQMVQMSKADIYFAVGVPFETTWLKKFIGVNPDMRIVHTDDGIDKKPIDRYETAASGPIHSKNGHHHHHETMDPHVWLSPPLVKVQARHILDALVSIDPDHREFYRKNYQDFIGQIAGLDTDFKALFTQSVRQTKFLVFHPSWGYFADAYGLTQISIEIEGKTPKAREVKNLIDFAKTHDIRIIFVQPQFSTKHAEIIAKEINGQLIEADPMAENWLENIRSVAESIRQAIK